MKLKSTLLMMFMFIGVVANAQVAAETSSNVKAEETIYRDVEVIASYRGGYDVFLKQVETATKNCKKGKLKKKDAEMLVEFVVGKDGKVSDFKVLKQDSDLCENDVKNAVYKSNQWIPARNNNKPVSSYVQFRIGLLNGAAYNNMRATTTLSL